MNAVGNRLARFTGRPAGLRRRTGFTLLELTIVVMIIGILAGISTYTYRMMINKARMTQAKAVLQHLFRTETVYFSNNGKYTDELTQLDFNPKKYDYYQVSVILDNNMMNFTGTATGIGLMTGDCWTITKAGSPVQCDNSVFK